MATKKKPCKSREKREEFIIAMLDRFLPELPTPFNQRETDHIRCNDNMQNPGMDPEPGKDLQSNRSCMA